MSEIFYILEMKWSLVILLDSVQMMRLIETSIYRMSLPVRILHCKLVRKLLPLSVPMVVRAIAFLAARVTKIANRIN